MWSKAFGVPFLKNSEGPIFFLFFSCSEYLALSRKYRGKLFGIPTFHFQVLEKSGSQIQIFLDLGAMFEGTGH